MLPGIDGFNTRQGQQKSLNFLKNLFKNPKVFFGEKHATDNLLSTNPHYIETVLWTKEVHLIQKQKRTHIFIFLKQG